MAEGPRVFISYSHDSDTHKQAVLQLAQTLRSRGIDAWLDQFEPFPPSGWPDWMMNEFSKARWVLVVCSSGYKSKMASEREAQGGRGVKWEGAIITRELYQQKGFNEKYIPIAVPNQIGFDIPDILSSFTFYDLHNEEAEENLYRLITAQPAVQPLALGPIEKFPLNPDKIANKKSGLILDHGFPSPGELFVGREQEIALLERARANGTCRVVSIASWGGSGKTALAVQWMRRLLPACSAEHLTVLAWSFYSQGVADREVSSDDFFAEAMKALGTTEEQPPSPSDRGAKLADMLADRNFVLVLDGVERLQYAEGELAGHFHDLAIQTLLQRLSKSSMGLTLLTSRVSINGIAPRDNRMHIEISLENLSDEAGEQIFRGLGVKGTTIQLRTASKDFEGHALSINLLGNYLREAWSGDIEKRFKLNFELQEGKFVERAGRVLHAYLDWYGASPSRDILLSVGLFAGPCRVSALVALATGPNLKGYNENLKGHGNTVQKGISALVRAKIIAVSSDSDPVIDTHPLVRSYFHDYGKAEHSDSLGSAHATLHEHFLSKCANLPVDLQELAVIVDAIWHGVKSGKASFCLNSLYKPRFQRYEEFYAANQLGAYGLMLSAVTPFFSDRWTVVTDTLTSWDQGYVLNQTGFALRSLGRTQEAMPTIEASFNLCKKNQDWENAHREATNLVEGRLAVGDLKGAFASARQSEQYARKINDEVSTRIALGYQAHVSQLLADFKNARYLFVQEFNPFRKNHSRTQFWEAISAAQYVRFLVADSKFDNACKRAREGIKQLRTDDAPLVIGITRLAFVHAEISNGRFPKKEDARREVVSNLGEGVAAIRKANQQSNLVVALLELANYRILAGEADLARAALDEAYAIISRSGFKLLEVDYLLTEQKLMSPADARKRISEARMLAEGIGYKQALEEIARLSSKLELPSPPPRRFARLLRER